MQKTLLEIWWAFMWYTVTTLIAIGWGLYFIMLQGSHGDVQEAVEAARWISYLIGSFVQVWVLKKLFTKKYPGFVATIREGESDK